MRQSSSQTHAHGRRLMLLTLMPLLHAFDIAFIPDDDAHKEYPYLRRTPKCSGKRSGNVPDYAEKVLHQVWWQGEANIPAHFAPLRESWMKQHPTWHFKVWDKAAIIALVESEAYAWFAPTFHALPAKIQKADVARYLILHSEGGVYADLDIEAFKSLDEVLDDSAMRSSMVFFEEPVTHWVAHRTVISNGLMASPKGHPMLQRILEGIRPVAEVFKSGGSEMLQTELSRCGLEEEELQKAKKKDGAMKAGAAKIMPCGCYITKSAELFFPLHTAMRRPEEFPHVRDHVEAMEDFVEHAASGKWPPKGAYTAQYWTISWIDPEMGELFLDGLQAARQDAYDDAKNSLLATVWSKWGNRYKYRNQPQPPAVAKARNAYEKAIELQPTYGFMYYELGNLRLEEAGSPDAEAADSAKATLRAQEQFAAAVAARPSSMLFVNNLGVALLNGNKSKEALPHFRKVLELNQDSFATIKGLDPESGARLNIGHALHTLGESEEASKHWLIVLRNGTFEYAKQAVQRLIAADMSDLLPSTGELDLIFGDILTKAGRMREAAMRFAGAYLAANKEDGELTSEGNELRAIVSKRMNALADVWDESGGHASPISASEKAKKDQPTVVQANADGTTSVQPLTPEMIKGMQQA